MTSWLSEVTSGVELPFPVAAAGLESAKSSDYEAAFTCFLAAARHGYSKAQFNTGVCYERGRGVGKDKGQVTTHTQIQPNTHTPADKYTLIGIHSWTQTTPSSHIQMLKHALPNLLCVLMLIPVVFIFSPVSLPTPSLSLHPLFPSLPPPLQALNFYSQAAAGGHSQAQYRYARLLLSCRGQQSAEDLDKAIHLLEQAAVAGLTQVRVQRSVGGVEMKATLILPPLTDSVLWFLSLSLLSLLMFPSHLFFPLCLFLPLLSFAASFLPIVLCLFYLYLFSLSFHPPFFP